MEKPYNPIRNKRLFPIDALIAAHRFPFLPEEPMPTKNPFAQLVLILEGAGTHTCEGICHSFGAGMLICRPANQAFETRWGGSKLHFALISFICDSPALKTMATAPITLFEEEIGTLLDLIKVGNRICEPIGDAETVQGMRLKEGTPEEAISYVYASLERFLTMLYFRLHHPGILADEEQKANRYLDQTDFVTEIKRYLHTNLWESLSLQDLCRRFGVAQSTLSRRFRAETHMGVMEYFTVIKMERAKELISSSTQNFAHIADALGFSSTGYFSKVFRAHVGMSPTEYSKRASKPRASVKSMQ